MKLSKVCTRCGEDKPLSQFHKQSTGPQGRHSWCKVCFNAYKRERDRKTYSPEQKRRWNLFTRYGLLPEDVEVLLDEQGGKCAICRQELQSFCIDHSHQTGEVRGLLCHRCNIVIGGWDDPEFKKLALAYLGGPHHSG